MSTETCLEMHPIQCSKASNFKGKIEGIQLEREQFLQHFATHQSPHAHCMSTADPNPDSELCPQVPGSPSLRDH